MLVLLIFNEGRNTFFIPFFQRCESALMQGEVPTMTLHTARHVRRERLSGTFPLFPREAVTESMMEFKSLNSPLPALITRHYLSSHLINIRNHIKTF